MSIYNPSSAPNAIPPGWYADPLAGGQARWWSGQDWTHHVQALPSLGPGDEAWEPINLVVPRASTMGTRALVWGIVSVVIPVTVAANTLAIVYGVLGLHHARRVATQGLSDSSRGRSIAGIVLGSLGLIILIALALVVFSARR